MGKSFKSPRKLDSLPPGARVRFGNITYGPVWRKCECERGCGAWSSRGRWFDHDFFAFPSESVVHYHNGQPFWVLDGL